MNLPNEHTTLYTALGRARKNQLHEPNPLWLKRLIRVAIVLAVLVCLAVFFTGVYLRHALKASLPQLDGNIHLADLSAPVTITRDPQGVPSIHASTLDDLLFAQGYITASDRLFQMDTLRRHGAGELAEILGSSLVEHDRLQRYLQLRTAADRALLTLPPDQLHQLQAYANGVNAFIANTQKHSPSAQGLSFEFHLLHYTPAPWTPRDSLLIGLVMAQDLSTSFPEKLNRESLATHLPAALLADMYPVGSWRDRPPTQTSTDLTTPTDAVEQIPLDRSQSSLICPPDNPKAGCPILTTASSSLGWVSHSTPSTSTEDLLHTSALLTPYHCESCRSGSNNWAIAAFRSATGAPLLSNDMHLGLTAPDIWYEAALHAPSVGLDVTGFTLPGVPFVISGRNANVAWGFTNTGADVQDVYIEHLRGGGGSGANTEFQRPDGSWATVGHQIEHIKVRAGRDITLDILTTTHNLGATILTTPIISPLYPSEHRSLSLAWNVYDPSVVTVPFFAMDTATDAASLVAAFAGFTFPSENLLYADAHHIGFHVIGRIPIRGSATPRPRPPAPLILPDATPNDDEDDESGALPATLQHATFSHPSTQQKTSVISTGGALLRRSGETPVFRTTSNSHHPHLLRARQTPDTIPQTIPQELTNITVGSPIADTPVDALDATQIWSGYIPYDALPSVLDPTSGVIATANARIAPNTYPYAIANNWADPYRAERITHVLETSSTPLTTADMLHLETDVHSEFDLLLAQRLAYAIDHAASAKNNPLLKQAADILRDWNGNLDADSPAAAIAFTARAQLWPMLLTPHLHNTTNPKTKLSPAALNRLLDLYTWGERYTALEQLLQHTPARWLPHAYPTWNDLLADAVAKALTAAKAPSDLRLLRYGQIHPVEIAHPIFGSHSVIASLLHYPTGTGLHPAGGDATTIKAAGLHFGPSERFTANLADPESTLANITTGESENPSSPHFLDQFLPWLNGTTFPLPLNHPTTTHTLTLTPK